jgi:hypothetical protein
VQPALADLVFFVAAGGRGCRLERSDAGGRCWGDTLRSAIAFLREGTTVFLQGQIESS